MDWPGSLSLAHAARTALAGAVMLVLGGVAYLWATVEILSGIDSSLAAALLFCAAILLFFGRVVPLVMSALGAATPSPTRPR